MPRKLPKVRTPAAELADRARPLADSPPSTPILFILLVTATAAFAGLATSVIGGRVGYRAAYFVAVFALIAVGGLITATRREPLRFAYLALIVAFPLAMAPIPPGRYEITVFHAAMAALAAGFLAKQWASPSRSFKSFFPTHGMLIAFLLAIPCVALSLFPLWSLREFILRNVLVYVFMLFALEELGREKGLERLALLLSVVLLAMSAGLFIDHFLQLNLSLRGSNLNQATVTASGLSIYRAGGFFQDPQRAGTYIACSIAFLLVLASRGRFAGMPMRFVVWLAIAAGTAAIVTTVSRSAILACFTFSAISLFFFNRWHAAIKLLVMGAAAAVAISFATMPLDHWVRLLPATMQDRVRSMHEELEFRKFIWFDTWDMFADHPVTGIGIASFRPYLLETRPAEFDYYGIGSAAGATYIPDQPESGYLKLLYEGGILGMLAALVLVGDALRRAVMVLLSRRADAHARTEILAALTAMATFGVTFITLYTASDERIAALFAVFIAVILYRSLQLRGATPGA